MFKKTIVAAANIMRVTSKEGVTREITLVDNCHFGNNMTAIVYMLKAFGCEINAHPLMKIVDKVSLMRVVITTIVGRLTKLSKKVGSLLMKNICYQRID